MEYDIVIAGHCGAYGASVLVQEKYDELAQRFPKGFLNQAISCPEYCCDDQPEGIYAVKAGESGIYKALWDLAELLDKGYYLNMRLFPVTQHTIEICEYFDISPYELYSRGCTVLAAENGFELVRHLESEGIPAVMVGQTVSSNDRLLYYDEEARFLKYTKKDALYKVIRRSRLNTELGE